MLGISGELRAESSRRRAEVGQEEQFRATGDRRAQLEWEVTGERGKEKKREEKGEAKNNVFELGKIPSNAAGFRTP